MIFAREFTERDKEQLLDMINETNKYDGNFEGMEVVRKIEDFNKFLNDLEIWKHQERINPNYSPQTTFGVFDDEKLVGGFVLRHSLKGRLINHGGNIGYFVRPSEREKGYGRALLKLALKEAKNTGLEKVLVTCRNDNMGSIKVIESNGGKCENNYYDESLGKTYRRYWFRCE